MRGYGQGHVDIAKELDTAREGGARLRLTLPLRAGGDA